MAAQSRKAPASAQVIPFPSTPSRRLKVHRDAERQRLYSAIMLATENGFIHANKDEKKLIELLRWTSFAGRDAVMAFAKQMRASQPYVDGVQK